MSTEQPLSSRSGPKAPFFLVVGMVVLGLIAFAVYRSDVFAPKGKSDEASFSKEEMQKMKESDQAEAPDASGVTTVKEYSFVPAEKLPQIKGVSSYKAMEARTVKFALNVWAGWAPIVFANGGFNAGKEWKTPAGQPFRVELVLIDNPVSMRDAYVAGDVHIGWATLDMVPLFMEEFRKDPRVMPRIFQQVDWSNGGDGIVVRDSVKSITDLRGKTVVLAQNSPSHYFLLNALISGGVQPAEVKMKFTEDAFQAAAAFHTDKSISGCVTWAPDIYTLSEVKGNRMLVTTATANKLIADVWFARADFAKDNPDIVEGLVRGIFDGMEALKTEAAKDQVAKLMAKGYSIPEKDARGMLADAHSTNFAENREFFMNANNPANFERTWDTANFLYKRINAITRAAAFDQVMDFTVLQKLEKEPKYASQRSEYDVSFTPRSVSSIKAESGEILTKTIVIHFYPNSWDIYKMVAAEENGQTTQKRYDPNAEAVIEEAGKLAGQFGAARIVIEGNTDASMKGVIGAEVVKTLSTNRANAVKEAILKKFSTLQANQFAVQGNGWDNLVDPENHSANRRVEVKVYPLESPE